MAQGSPPAGDLGQAPADQAPPGGGVSPWDALTSVATARLVLAVLLLAVAVVGIRATVHATSWDDGPWHGHGTVLAVALEVILLPLLAAVVVRRRRDPHAGQPAAGLRTLLGVVLLLGVLAIPLLLALSHAHWGRPPRTPPGSSHQQQAGRPHASRVVTHPLGTAATATVLNTLLAAILLALIVWAVLRILRRTRVRRLDQGDFIIEEPQAQLRRAVESGRAALQAIDDARLAIIACYVAMEGSLASAGAVRRDAETPDELLGRAAAAGLVHGGEAGRLTELFYEARFSSHALPGGRRDEAQRALTVLAADLAGRGPAAAGTGAGGAGAGGAGAGGAS